MIDDWLRGKRPNPKPTRYGTRAVTLDTRAGETITLDGTLRTR